MKPRREFFFWLAILGALAGITTRADTVTDRLEQMRPDLTNLCSVRLATWRFHKPDVAGGEQPGFDDQGWQEVNPGFSWPGENTKAWFRTTVTLPPTVAGQPIDGVPVRLDMGIDDDGELYVEGVLKEAFHWDDGHYTLTSHAQPGQTFHLALRGINGPGDGQLHFATLNFDLLPEFEQYLTETKWLTLLADRVPEKEKSLISGTLHTSEEEIHFTAITKENLETVRSQLSRAAADLSVLEPLTRRYEVYYVGHAHIDMNWLWPWPETLDVCRRTWNSAMNLMDEFPDFRFVQSQPGAYAGLKTNAPAEFARIQTEVQAGHWDPVGGLWNESDTDIPSGEGLARSFLLGQRFFKENFGRYAKTGWLPDSFGHSWQMPQIMKLAEIRYFYHMRCGTDMPLSWWESPDGSRVLKANTGNYDEDVQLDQLLAPADSEHRWGLPQSLVVYGVGDHGGGPTREHVLKIKAFQNDPVLPRVHFASADEFFDQLSERPGVEALPVVDTDLQFTLEGCYTTHADMKKAIRGGENEYYSAEVLSSLAAMTGQSYPAKEFGEAWKPLAFAQFHDIACGSAIHSTYDWMHEELAPALQFVRSQTEKSLESLTACVDTRGADPAAIVVWNTLAFDRTDVVKLPVPNADSFHSVVDADGRKYPAQTMDGTNLVFVARGVPAFGCTVYHPKPEDAPPDNIEFSETAGTMDISAAGYDLQIDKVSGAMRRLFLFEAQWNVFGDATNADALQLIGDSGNAWLIQPTGASSILSTEGTSVTALDQGPVFDRVRVKHASGNSTYSQDIIAYGALGRIDIPTKVNWQEVHQTLKLVLPIQAQQPEVEAQVPFGSIWRPQNGQECPGQKWMDVTENTPVPVRSATPLDLAAWYNANSTENLDGGGYGYPAEYFPQGRLRLGGSQIPFDLPGDHPGELNQIVTDGQEIPLPRTVGQDTLYLLAARVNGNDWTDVGFRLANGKIERRAFALNDWIVPKFGDNELGISMPGRKTPGGRDNLPSNMWLTQVPLPAGVTSMILPRDQNVHLFAATTAAKTTGAGQYGLSILNDSKYGFDFATNVFRLTLLRSSTEPDPHPDQGEQTFTYSLYPHTGGWRTADTEDQALALNVPLLARLVPAHEPKGQLPTVSVKNIGGAGQLIVTALKHSEDGDGYILRFYEANGQDTMARIAFDHNLKAEAVDILENSLPGDLVKVQGNVCTLPVRHNQIVTLRIAFAED